MPTTTPAPAPPELDLLTPTWCPRTQPTDYLRALMCGHPRETDNAWLTRALRDLLLLLFARSTGGVTEPIYCEDLGDSIHVDRNGAVPLLAEAEALGAISVARDAKGRLRWPPRSDRFTGHVIVLNPLRVGEPMPEGWDGRAFARSARPVTKAERKRQARRFEPAPAPKAKKQLTPEQKAGKELGKRKAQLARAEAMDAHFNHIEGEDHDRYSMVRIIKEADAWREGQGLPELTAFEIQRFYIEPIRELVAARMNVATIRAGFERALVAGCHTQKVTETTGRFGRLVAHQAKLHAGQLALRRAESRSAQKAAVAPAGDATKKAREILEEARELNYAGRDQDARALLDDALALVPQLAELFGGSHELADAHLRLAFKKGQWDFEGAYESRGFHDYLPGWEWPAELEEVA